MGRKVWGTTPRPYPCIGNRHPMADRDPHIREGIVRRTRSIASSRPSGTLNLKEQGCELERYKASRVPQIQNPKGEEPIEKSRHRREEQDRQKRTNPKTAHRGEERGTPRVQSAGGERREENPDKVDHHKEEGTQEEKPTQRTAPKTLLKSAREGQEAETVAGRGVSHKGGMVVVSDRAKKATLARLLGMDATVVVMPQGQLAMIVKRNIHKRNCPKKTRRRVARERQEGGMPRGTQCAGEMPQGERSPERQPGKDPGQDEGS